MSLMNTLKKEEARTIFGKKELEIIEKQLLGMKLTQSEKNRLSRNIRKKLEIIKELSKYQNEFNLKHSAELKRRIEEIKENILKSEYFQNIKRIILFGSTAEKSHIFRSDIDIAVDFNNITLKEATKFRIKFNYNDKIDLQVYNTLPEKIKLEIEKKGKIIYERKNK
jgi:predicted nucleotidyltransferase